MEVGWVAGVVVLVVGIAMLAGYLLGIITTTQGAGVAGVFSDSASSQAIPEACSGKCDQYHAVRKQLCDVKREESFRRNELAAFIRRRDEAWRSAAGLYAAAAIAALVPFIGPLIASGLLLSAMAAQATAAFFLGAIEAAERDVASSTVLRQSLMSNLENRKSDMRSVCGPDFLTDCVSKEVACPYDALVPA